MSATASQTDLPQSGLAWLTLAMSTSALLLLCVWALMNQDKLFHRGAAIVNLPAQTELSKQTAASTNVQSNSSAAQQNTVERVVTQTANAEKPLTEKRAAPDAKIDELVAANSTSENLDNKPPANLTPVSSNDSASAETVRNAAASKLAAEKIAAEDAKRASDKLALEEAAQAKLAATKLATQKAAAAKLAAEKLAAEAELAAQKLAAENAAKAKLEAEEIAAAKLQEEQAAAQKLARETAEAEALATERRAQEVATAEQAAAEEIALAEAEANRLAEQELIEARLAAEKQQAEQLAALPKRLIPSAANVVAPSAVVPVTESAFEKSRREELAQLAGLSAQVRFKTNDIEPSESSKQPMDRLFELLFLYSETSVTVQVASNEYEIDNNNQLISRERALTLVNYLIERGLDEERFRIRALGKQRLPFDSHQVTVVATVIDK